MSNDTEIKDAEVIAATPEAIPEPTRTVSALVQGAVTITLGDDGSLSVNAPQNVLIALAIIKAGEVYLTGQMQDQMRKAAQIRPTIVPGNSDMLNMMKKLNRPS